MNIKICISSVLLTISSAMYAQQIGVSANLLDVAALGTLNAEVSYAVSRHWSITAGGRFNPFTYNKGDVDRQFQYRQQSYAIGARFWQWHIWSGWWFASKLRYQEYNAGGIISRETRQGDRVGLGLYAGYAHMLSDHLNIEFGIGFWGGADIYEVYDCPVCGQTLDKGSKFFLLPDDMMISLAYVF